MREGELGIEPDGRKGSETERGRFGFITGKRGSDLKEERAAVRNRRFDVILRERKSRMWM